MSDTNQPARPDASSWLLRAGYGVLIVSAAALLTELVGDVIAAMETGEHAVDEESALHHLFIFEWAFPVLLVTAGVTLIAGLVALVLGRFRQSAATFRYGLWAAGYSVVAVIVLFTVGGFEL
ncbi:MAG: hypothetical protein ACRDGJ_05745 [Candidatus Limnocylindria bacterium]